jgi:hypothetical protein
MAHPVDSVQTPSQPPSSHSSEQLVAVALHDDVQAMSAHSTWQLAWSPHAPPESLPASSPPSSSVEFTSPSGTAFAPASTAASSSPASPPSGALNSASKSRVQPAHTSKIAKPTAPPPRLLTRHLAPALTRCIDRAFAAVILAVLTILIRPALAWAENSIPPATIAEARTLFRKGSSLYRDGHYEEALEALRGSYDRVASPNSELLIARCLRELGEPVEAESAFAQAEATAQARVTAGEPRYAPTAEAAAAEGAKVRATLGLLRVRIENPQPDMRLEIGGRGAEIPLGGEVVLRHAPGDIEVTLRSSSGEQKQVVTMRAGSETTVDLAPVPHADAVAPPAPAPEVPPASPPAPPAPALAATPLPPAIEPAPGWFAPVAIGAGVVAAGGLGVFVGFGLASNQNYVDLRDRCGPDRCGSLDLEQANAGKRQQTIADVALGVGVVAAATCATFTVLTLVRPHRVQRPASSLRLRWTGLGVTLGGELE